MPQDGLGPSREPRADWFRRHGLKLRHLAMLLAVDRTRSIGRAAEDLHTSQPAASRTILEIERATGVALFERRANGTFPTPAGAALVRHAREIFGSLERAGREIETIAMGSSGALTVGCNYSSAAYLLPQAVIRLKRAAPGLAVSIREGSLESLLPDLRSRQLDIVVARPLHGRREQDLNERVLFEEPMCVVCAPDHPLTRMRRPRWAELGRWPWIMPPRGTPVRDGLEEFFRRQRLTPIDTGIECVSILASSQLLKHLQAVTVAPSAVARHYDGYGLLRTLPFRLPLVFGPIAAITLTQREPTPAVSVFLDCLSRVSARI